MSGIFDDVNGKGMSMGKNAVTSSVRLIKPRLSAPERRAAELAANAGKQAQLKREAAERRAARALRDARAQPEPRKSGVTRRPRPR